MRLNRKLVLSFSLLIAMCGNSFAMRRFIEENPDACLCPSPEYSLNTPASAMLIFSGKVSKVAISSSAVDNTFEVGQIWKGPPFAQFHIFTSTGSCRSAYDLGNSYLVFANPQVPFLESSTKNPWSTNYCLSSQPLNSATQALDILGPSSKPRNLQFVSLKRTSGFSDWPDYDITITAAGKSFFSNHRSTTSVALTGAISNAELAKLIAEVKRSGLLDTWPQFEKSGIARFDAPGAMICASIEGQYRCLTRDHTPDMEPQEFLVLADHIDAVAGTQKWLPKPWPDGFWPSRKDLKDHPTH